MYIFVIVTSVFKVISSSGDLGSTFDVFAQVGAIMCVHKSCSATFTIKTRPTVHFSANTELKH